MSNRFCLDTDIIITILNRRDPNLVDKFLDLISNDHKPFITSFSQGELLFGAYNSFNVGENIRNLYDVFNQCNQINITKKTCEIYADLKYELRKKGITVSDINLWTASLVKENQLTLVSRNSQFKLITSIQTLDWL